MLWNTNRSVYTASKIAFKYRPLINIHKSIHQNAVSHPCNLEKSYSLDQKLACGTKDEQLRVLLHLTTCTEQTARAKREKAQRKVWILYLIWGQICALHLYGLMVLNCFVRSSKNVRSRSFTRGCHGRKRRSPEEISDQIQLRQRERRRNTLIHYYSKSC